MNVLTIFDQRISAIFEQGAPGSRLPFSFKRLAKRAVREMEDETFVIDGVDTAPALYTVLVSQADDDLMRPMYVQITDEVSQLIEAQAKKRGYTFVGRPLVRFMVDPALRSGRFSLFAENIDPRTLARLRDEENAYLGLTPPHEVSAGQGYMPASVPVHEEEPAPVAQQVAFVPEAVLEPEPPIEPEPAFEPEPAPASDPFADSIDEILADQGLFVTPAEEPQGASADVDDLDEPVASPEDFADDFAPEEPEADIVVGAHVAPEPALEPEPAPQPAHIAPEPELVPAPAPAHAAPEPEPAPAAQPEPACTLVDLGSGKTYRVTTPQATIGRERVAGGVVLSDPNASRRHAELVFSAGGWDVRDLNSTNGTLVNDVDVPQARLHDGDVLTIGLTNLEFRAG